jgi:hypothetical protein
VNIAQTASTRAAKRRSQPRTVSGGRSNTAAISRCPALSPSRSTPPRSPRRCQRPAATARPGADMHGAAAGAPRPPRSDLQPAVGDADLPGTGTAHRTARPSIPDTSRPEPSRSSTATGPVSTVSIAPPSATTRPSPHRPGQGHSGRAVAYPDPTIVAVTALDPHAQRRTSTTTSSSPKAVNSGRPVCHVRGLRRFGPTLTPPGAPAPGTDQGRP